MTSPILIDRPHDGIPPVTASPAQLHQAVARLRAGSGPVAIDAERASSYRYSARAYLIQLRREGAGTFLIDPLATGSLEELDSVLAPVPWLAHDAAQDLPCLAEIGLKPRSLFDTEVAFKLLGYEKYGLAAACSELLGVTLAKEYSAVDWSQRPLPPAWLNYAALDVEFLIPLYQELAHRLVAAGKDEWAYQEFEHIRCAPQPVAKTSPWRELRGAGRIRTRRGLAILRSLYYCRDEIGKEHDIAPSSLISNRNLITLAQAEPRNRRQLLRFDFMRKPDVKPYTKEFAFACLRVWEADPQSYPQRLRGQRSTDSGRFSKQHQPAAYDRLMRIREVVAQIAAQRQVLGQLLFPPAKQRQLALAPHDVPEKLRDLDLRPWQLELLTDPLTQVLSAADSQ